MTAARDTITMRRIAAFVLAVNAAYAIGIHTVAARAVSAAGCVSALALLLPASAEPVPVAWPIVPAAAFTLPVLALLGPLTIACWHADARGLLIVAWLITIGWLLWAVHARPEQRTSAPRSPLLTILFIGWTSLFWFSVVWDVGIGRAVLNTTRDDRVTWTFRLWQTHPPSEHLFLMWLRPEDFANHLAYTNHLHPYLFWLYGIVWLVQIASRSPLYVARNVTPFAVAGVGVVAFTFMLIQSRWSSTQASAKWYASLFLALGLFLSEWHFWISMYTTNFDDVFPLIVFLLAILAACAAARPSRAGSRLLIASAIVFGAVGWVYTPVAILALWCYYGRLRSGADVIRRNRALINASLACAVTGAITILVPRVLVALKGYATVSSPFVFRSGLDGDTRYFHDVAQAVLRPFYGGARTWWSILFPAFVPVVIWLTWGTTGAARARRRLARALLFLSSPYLFSVAVFPQSVSIHPYLYDQLLFLPAVLVGAVWALSPQVQRRVRGPSVLALLLLVAALLMANLIAIAQGVRATLPA